MIALLRDPVDRAHSNWTHLWSAGLEPEGDFLRACDLEERRAAPWLGAVLAVPGARPVRRAAAAAARGGAARAGAACCATGTCARRPVETLDTIFDFLGVETGAVTEIPAENVTTHVTDSTRNRVIGAALRAGSRVGHGRLRPAWTPVGEWLSRHLQREQNLRRPLSPEHRAALLPRVADDVRLLEQVTGADFGDWLDAGHAAQRPVAAPGRQDRDGLPEHRRPVRRPGGGRARRDCRRA